MTLKIGVIGIGDIAKKAYLPITSRNPDIDLYVFTRNINTRETMKQEYPSISIVNSLEDLFKMNLNGVMIHSSTNSHYEICKSFIKHQIPVFVDKPISNNIKEVKELFDLAKENNVILRTGFNRRYAPSIKNAHDKETPTLLVYQKNREHTLSDDTSFLYDDFIHVIDTSRYLLKEDIIKIHVKESRVKSKLTSLHVFLETPTNSATLIMNRDSGKTREKVELIYPGETVIIEELSTYKNMKNNTTFLYSTDSWATTLQKRGFESMINKFFDDLKISKSFDNNDLDSLKTHELCESILQTIQ